MQKPKKKKSNIYIGEIYLSPDGIVIENDNESKTFSIDDIEGLTAHLAKVALDPPNQDARTDWSWESPGKGHIHYVDGNKTGAYINIEKNMHREFHEYYENIYKEKT